MVIGLDACGSFVAAPATSGFESSAVAAATVPAEARVELAAWTDERLALWGREDLDEFHAAPMSWAQRHEVCEMLGARGDVHAAVIVTSSLLLRNKEAVTAHRARQRALAEASLA